jgi:hypothetical protein
LGLLPVTRPTPPTASFPNGIKTEVLAAGSDFLRIHHQDNGPIWFGPKPGLPPANRFDASGGEYRVLYAAEGLDGAFAETILHGRTKERILTRANVNLRAWTAIQTRRDLVLVKLYDEGLFWHGTDAGVSASNDYSEPRRLALALYRECMTADGLIYRSRHDNGELCYALFDRVDASDLEPGAKELFRNHSSEIDDLAAKYGAVFDTSPSVPAP